MDREWLTNMTRATWKGTSWQSHDPTLAARQRTQKARQRIHDLQMYFVVHAGIVNQALESFQVQLRVVPGNTQESVTNPHGFSLLLGGQTLTLVPTDTHLHVDLAHYRTFVPSRLRAASLELEEDPLGDVRWVHATRTLSSVEDLAKFLLELLFRAWRMG